MRDDSMIRPRYATKANVTLLSFAVVLAAASFAGCKDNTRPPDKHGGDGGHEAEGGGGAANEGGGGAAQGGGGEGGMGDGGAGGEGGGRPPSIVQLAAGFAHTCVLRSNGTVRCWGDNAYGQLGYGDTTVIGDDETPAAANAGDVDVGGFVVDIVAGDDHTCARLQGGAVRCWGRGEHGRLGYSNVKDIGDDEAPSSAGEVDVGGPIDGFAAAWSHTCVQLATGTLRCWGFGSYGKLGYGNTLAIGDDEAPSTAGDVNVGGPITALALGDEHSCAVVSGTVRCWGWGSAGRLGYKNQNDIGDDEAPAVAGNVDVGGTIVKLAAGYAHTCALSNEGAVRCWGANGSGQLGYANTLTIGDDEVPSVAGDVDIGGFVEQIVAGYAHTCARLEGGHVRCWGQGNAGQLGNASVFSTGDDETPASVGDVDVGGVVVQLAAGYAHTCALLDTNAVRCWGFNGFGQLGYGNTKDIGDDEVASVAGDVPLP